MRRVTWATLGAGAGFLAVRALVPLTGRRTPNGGSAGAGGFGARFADFWALVQVAAAEREAELRDALGLDGRHDLVDAPGNAVGRIGDVEDNR